jgi:ubiquitin-protein ligase E3 C
LWTTLSNVAFDPNYGLWAVTPKTNLMYPSSTSHLIHSNSLELYTFLGRILGKAMFEGIVVQPNFAHFFLQKVLGKFSSLNDLGSLDEELFRNLMFLKKFTGDASDLMLSFSITEDVLGVTSEIDLCPNGSRIDVTSTNKLKYVYQMANYRLNVKIKQQCDAFLNGMRDIVPVDWLRMFSEKELQWLISGSDQPIDVQDLKHHCQYAGGYNGMSAGVRRFWKVVNGFTPHEKKQLLKFVTSCERAPPLGFQALHPPFQIQYVGGAPNKLPSASTCFNTLKLPSYASDKVCREKLLYSIMSDAGFDLS